MSSRFYLPDHISSSPFIMHRGNNIYLMFFFVRAFAYSSFFPILPPTQQFSFALTLKYFGMENQEGDASVQAQEDRRACEDDPNSPGWWIRNRTKTLVIKEKSKGSIIIKEQLQCVACNYPYSSGGKNGMGDLQVQRHYDSE